MCRLGVKRGLIWADAFTTVVDDDNKERLVCHFAHMESLGKMLGHGLAIYDDKREEFQRLSTLDLRELWRWPAQAHPIHHEADEVDYLLLGEVYPAVRVPARLSEFTNLESYEAWSCLLPGSTTDDPKLDRDKDGKLRWRWRRGSPPVDHVVEEKLIDAGLMKLDEALGQAVDVDSGERIRLHRGPVGWNPYRSNALTGKPATAFSKSKCAPPSSAGKVRVFLMQHYSSVAVDCGLKTIAFNRFLVNQSRWTTSMSLRAQK